MIEARWTQVFVAALVMIGVYTPSAYAFSSKNTSAEAQQGAASASSSIWITRGDGATSCGLKKGQSLEEGAEELKRNGIRVIGSRKGHDGKMHGQACGMETGSLNAYQIARDDLVKAVSLGYQEDK